MKQFIKNLKFQSTKVSKKLKFEIFFPYTGAASMSLRYLTQMSPQVLGICHKCLLIIENANIKDGSWIVWHLGHNSHQPVAVVLFVRLTRLFFNT